MANKQVKDYVQNRYTTLVKEISELKDNAELGEDERSVLIDHKKERISEVANMASQFGVPLQDLIRKAEKKLRK